MSNIYLEKIISSNDSFFSSLNADILESLNASNNIIEVNESLAKKGHFSFYCKQNNFLYYILKAKSKKNEYCLVKEEEDNFDYTGCGGIEFSPHIQYSLNFDTKEISIIAINIESDYLMFYLKLHNTFVNGIGNKSKNSLFTLLMFCHNDSTLVENNPTNEVLTNKCYYEKEFPKKISNFYTQMRILGESFPEEVADLILCNIKSNELNDDNLELQFDEVLKLTPSIIKMNTVDINNFKIKDEYNL